MTPAELKALRYALGLSQRELGEALGYTGAHVAQTIRRYEDGHRPMPPLFLWAAQALADGYRPPSWPAI
jgi:transcriptional regulator with XRE-family HTH domain